MLTEGELRKADVSSEVALRCVETQRLDHEVGFETSFLQALFHQLHRANAGQRIQVAVYSNNVCSYTEDHVTPSGFATKA